MPAIRPSISQLANRSTNNRSLTLEELRPMFVDYPEKSRRFAEKVFEEVLQIS
jgi:hypothetical protein